MPGASVGLPVTHGDNHNPHALKATTAVQAVIAHVRAWILAEGAMPGATLPPEREFAAQLGVSRATLRQALATLNHMGLITSVRGRNGGARVSAPTAATVGASVSLLLQTRALTALDLTEVRRGLECEAARLAALRHSNEERTEIERVLNLYLAFTHDVAASNQWGRRLHHLIAQASHNPLLIQMLLSVDVAFAECVDLLWAMPEIRDETEAIHRPIVDAIAAGDEEGAHDAMIRHFDQITRAFADRGLTDRRLGSNRLSALGRTAPEQSSAGCMEGGQPSPGSA